MIEGTGRPSGYYIVVGQVVNYEIAISLHVQHILATRGDDALAGGQSLYRI